MEKIRGGLREGAGRKSAYPNKQKVAVMLMSPYGHGLLASVQERTGLSRNDILTHLALLHAADLSFEGIDGVVYRGKDANFVMSIRCTDHAFALLQAARRRTGKSFSDLGESLVERWGAYASYPVLPTAKRRTRRRGTP